ncbi:MAG: protein kinase [Acidobacteriota bacterium]
MPPYSNDDVTADHVTRAGTTGVSSVATSLTSRFAPDRYRLIALLGRGGMGEVYRADDLTLDLPVALKFLPDRIAAGDPRLPQFHNELRIARQVSHKNVCRVCDLGESDGRRFLTMEYVDGEDLSSDPDRCPASALTVAAALPGADPLAAGETPSPDMLAAAGKTETLSVKWGLLAVAAVVAGLLTFAGMSSRTSLIGRVPLV